MKKSAHTSIKILRHAYLMRIEGVWSHYIISQRGEDIEFYPGLELIDVFYKLKETRPDYTPRVIYNKGIEDYLKDIKHERELEYCKKFYADIHSRS